MVTLISTQETLKQKLQAQVNPTVVFADIDGTLFSPNHLIVTAPFYNRKIAHYLHTQNIPFVAVTGRSDLTSVDKFHLSLLGFEPDCVVSANGTVIYQRLANKTYARDMEWEAIMQYSKVKYADGKVESWNKLDISNGIKEYLTRQHHSFTFGTGNTFLIRIKFITIPLTRLEEIRKDLLSLFPSGIRIIYTEKLLRKNTLDIFSGEMLITPKFGGKDNAVKYLLTKYAKQMGKVTDALIFGDATVDIPMLTMKDNLKYYALFQYLVHPTPLARKFAQQAQKSNPHLHILSGNGPREIFKVIKTLSVKSQPVNFPLLIGEGQSEVISKSNVILREARPSPKRGSPLREESVSKQTKHSFVISRHLREDSSESGSEVEKSQQTNNKTIKQSQFSPAQNNPIRKLIQVAEPLLDRLVDKNLSPNEVSFLGLTKLQTGLNQIYSEQNSALQKIKGLYNYGFGNLTDVLDGIRARQHRNVISSRPFREDSPESGEVEKSQNIQNTKYQIADTTPGQLVDGFSDRAKEFMQLFIRAKKRLSNVIARSEATKQSQQWSNETIEQSVSTFLTALSCALPSIARAQVEISGKTVSERDEKGGSMIDRTKKLYLSLLMDTLNVQTQSEAIDQKIYSSNIATFENRLSVISNERGKSFVRHPELDSGSLSSFQKKALERWLLYIDILQQEDVIIKDYLIKYPKVLKEYEKESQKLTKEYLSLPIKTLRKKWNIKDYKLKIKRYI